MNYSAINIYTVHRIIKNEMYPVPTLGRNLEEVHSHFNTMAEEKIFAGTNNISGLFCPHLESLARGDIFTISDYFEKLRREK